MNQQKYQLRWFALLLIVMALFFVGLLWVNYQFANSAVGKGGFIIRYSGAKALLKSGLNPYSEELLQWFYQQQYKIYSGIGGEKFVLEIPLYSLFVYAPLIFLENPVHAQAIWMMLQEIAVIGLVFVVLDVYEWSPSAWVKGVLLFVAIAFYHTIQGIIEGGLFILVTLLLGLMLKCIKTGQDELTGLILASMLIAPATSAGVIIFTLFFGVFQKRFRIIFTFLGAFGVLFVVSYFVFPGWLLNYIRVLFVGGHFNPGQALVGKIAQITPGIFSQLRLILLMGFGGLLLHEWYSFRRAQFDGFLWCVMVTAVIGSFLIPGKNSTSYILLIPGLMLIMRGIYSRWSNAGDWIVVMLWVSVFVIVWLVFLISGQEVYFPMQKEIMFFVVPVMGLIGLYWIKWWVLLPTRSILGRDL